MPSLASGLARGFANYLDGQQQADERHFQRERQRMFDDRQRAMMELQAQQIRDSMGRAGRELDLRENEARRGAFEAGYIPATQVQREGETFSAAAPGFDGAGPMGAPNLVTLATGVAGLGMQANAKRPPFQIGGEGYVKARENPLERIAAENQRTMERKAVADSQRRAALLHALPARDRDVGEGLDMASLENFVTMMRREARQPATAPSYQMVQTDDGLVAVDPRNPRNATRVQVDGAPIRGRGTSRDAYIAQHWRNFVTIRELGIPTGERSPEEAERLAGEQFDRIHGAGPQRSIRTATDKDIADALDEAGGDSARAKQILRAKGLQ